jgi:hypothetical protein
MARERAKLTDKEEKILVQAQLMGLTTASMVKIGNRLKALEHEREVKAEIDTVTSQFSYKQKEGKLGWEITTSDGHVWHFTNRHYNSRNVGWNYKKTISYTICLEKPGTRFQPRVSKNHELYISDDWGPAKFMPEKSKELYAMMRGITNNRFKLENKK